MRCRGCVRCARFCLRTANYVLLSLGLVMLAYSCFMYAEFRKKEAHHMMLSPPPPLPAPPSPHKGRHHPPPPPRHHHPSPTPGDVFPPSYAPTQTHAHHHHHDSDTDAVADVAADTLFYGKRGNTTAAPDLSLSLAARVAGVPPSLNMTDVDINLEQYWFVYAFGASGLFTILTATTGIVYTNTESLCCLNFYTYLLVMMLLGQAGLAIALFTDTGLDRIPEDVTGNEREVMHFLHEHYDIAKWAALGMLILEILSAMLACALKACGPTEESDDEEEDSLRQPLTSRSVSSVGSRGGGDAVAGPSGSARGSGRTFNHRVQTNSALKYDQWRARMRDKYKLDTERLVYDPEQQGEPEPSLDEYANTPQASRNNCVIA